MRAGGEDTENAAKQIINHWIKNLPGELYQRISSVNDRRPAARGCLKDIIRGEFQTRKDFFKTLGIALPRSYSVNDE